MTSPDLRAIAHRGMALGPSPGLRHQKTGKHMVREGVAFTQQDYLGAGFNFAAVLGPSPPLPRIVALAEEFFKGLPGAYGILVEADAGHPVEAEMRAGGWQIAEDEPALVLACIPEPSPLPRGLEIHCVSTASELRALCVMLGTAFETPPELNAQFLPPPSVLLDPEIAYFLGCSEGQAVCGAVLLCQDAIATIHGVATLHAYRRRGFAKAVTWAAIHEGARRGCTTAALRAMGASYEMYQRMGFVPVCHHRTYTAPPSSDTDKIVRSTK